MRSYLHPDVVNGGSETKNHTNILRAVSHIFSGGFSQSGGGWAIFRRIILLGSVLFSSFFLCRHFLVGGGLEALGGYLLPEHLSSLSMLLAMVILNQLLEMIKWHFLVRTVDRKIPFSSIIESQLGGFSLGSVTPGRIGETAGRALLLPAEKRKCLFFLSLNSSFSIFVSSLILGIYPAFYYSGGHVIAQVFLIFTLILSLCFLFPFLSRSVLLRLGMSEEIVKLFSSQIQTKVLLLSIMRVMVYSFQLVLVLSISPGFENNAMLPSIALLYYGILTILPSFIFSEIGIRGGAMLIVAELCSIDFHDLIGPLSFVWVLNVLIPSLAGSLLLLRKVRSFF